MNTTVRPPIADDITCRECHENRCRDCTRPGGTRLAADDQRYPTCCCGRWFRTDRAAEDHGTTPEALAERLGVDVELVRDYAGRTAHIHDPAHSVGPAKTARWTGATLNDEHVAAITRHIERNRAEFGEPVVTDQPGRIWKITGPNSMHSPGGRCDDDFCIATVCDGVTHVDATGRTFTRDDR